MEQHKANPWVVLIKKNPKAEIRLFCFAYAGGAPSIFRSWSNLLLPQVEACAIQLPGRENRLREKPYSNFEPLVKEITAAIMEYMDKPYALFGHSLGAMLSFEVVRHLRREKVQKPKYLFVSGKRAVCLPNKLPLLYHLPEREFIEGLKRYNGIPDIILQEPELMRLFLPMLRADITVNETYRYLPEAPLECPIMAFGGIKDNTVSCNEVQDWYQLTNSRFDSHFFPGGHFFLNEYKKELLQFINKELLEICGTLQPFPQAQSGLL